MEDDGLVAKGPGKYGCGDPIVRGINCGDSCATAEFLCRACSFKRMEHIRPSTDSLPAGRVAELAREILDIAELAAGR